MKRILVGILAFLVIAVGVVVWQNRKVTPETESPPDKPPSSVKPQELPEKAMKPSPFEVATDSGAADRDRILALAKLSNELTPREVKGLRTVVDDQIADETVRNDA